MAAHIFKGTLSGCAKRSRCRMVSKSTRTRVALFGAKVKVCSGSRPVATTQVTTLSVHLGLLSSFDQLRRPRSLWLSPDLLLLRLLLGNW